MLSSPAVDRPLARSVGRRVRPSRILPALFLLLLSLGLATGCSNVHITGTSLQPPAPPSGPPPSSGQTGAVTISPRYAAIAPGQTFQFTATATNGGAIQWSASGGTVDGSGRFTAPASISQSENITVTAALAASPQQDNATAVMSIIQPGKVQCPTATGNPQVAQYAVYLPSPGKASVEFGTSTNYGLNTWQVPTPSSNGGQAQLWVAGMLAKTTYHMRGQVVLDNGATFNDADQTCTTGAVPAPGPSPVKVTTSGMGTPQPGIEMWNTVLPQSFTQLFATDLKGNVLWTYNYQHTVSDMVQGVQLVPNGDLVMVISFLSSTNGTSDPNIINEVREVDLAGNTVRSVAVASMNQKLAAMNAHDASGTPYVVRSFHHNVLVLPNGHWVLLAAYAKGISDVTGFPGNNLVLGDVLIDVDPNGNPDWEWSTFDHLDPNRHPMNFPDWTHSNAMLYSADDHNLLLSVRHQNWILKIDFNDGTGSGKILWKLGYQGDFTLVGGSDPVDWFYAQHGMSFTTPNTTGDFGLIMMDNGNDRYLNPNQQLHCNPFAGAPLDTGCYSTMPVFEINENNRTATLVHHYKPGVYGTYGTVTGNSFFSFFGGNAEKLANGDYEVSFSATLSKAGVVQELDPVNLQPLWEADTPGADQYHVNRWPSLYPGVQW